MPHLHAWASAGEGDKSRRSPPLENKKNVVFLLYWGPFCYFFSTWGNGVTKEHGAGSMGEAACGRCRRGNQYAAKEFKKYIYMEKFFKI